MVSVTEGDRFCDSCDSATRTAKLAIWGAGPASLPLQANLCRGCWTMLLAGLRSWLNEVP
jgi:hypothetical protein